MVLCEDLEGWRGGRLRREGIYIHLYLIYVVVQKKPTKHFKTFVFQLKINKN